LQRLRRQRRADHADAIAIVDAPGVDAHWVRRLLPRCQAPLVIRSAGVRCIGLERTIGELDPYPKAPNVATDKPCA
jgi:hypothetical protein